MSRRVLFSVSFLLFSIAGLFGLSVLLKNKKDTIVIGAALDYPPFSIMENGQSSGFDIDLISEIALSIGKEVRFKYFSYSDLINAISNGEVDVVISGIPVSIAKRSKLPYVRYVTVFANENDCMVRLHRDGENKVDTKRVVRIGVQSCTETEIRLRSIGAAVLDDISSSKVLAMGSTEELVDALQDGSVDYLFMTNSRFDYINAREGGHLVCDPIHSAKRRGMSVLRDYAIVISDKSNLHKSISDALDSMIDSGSYDVLRMNWIAA